MAEYDCIVVGARCAGAALAAYAARAGMRVLALEADALHTDQPFSTHAIQALGLDRLDELGVGARIRAVTPAITVARVSVRDSHLDLHLPEARAMYCPRRSVLDPLLQDAALQSGAELRAGARVTRLLYDGERVCGVVAQHKGAGTQEYRARWVVGADGRHSTVARLAGAPNYIEHTSERAGYWAYYQKPACWEGEDPWKQFHTAIWLDDIARFAFQCDGELLIMGAFAPFEQAQAWRGDYPKALHDALMASPLTAALAEAGPVTAPIGLMKGKYFVRKPIGPGWALVGDAGLHKDPTPGYGITDALCDAKALARALVAGDSPALHTYWRERDEIAIPMYFQSLRLGHRKFVNAFNELFLERVHQDPALCARMVEVIERTRSPFDVVPNTRVLAWVAGALLRGRTDVVKGFGYMAMLNDLLRRGQARSSELQTQLV